MAEGDAQTSASRGGEDSLLVPSLHAGFFEELDQSSVPWCGLGTFRLQANERGVISDRVFSIEEMEAIEAAAREIPQEIRLDGRPTRFWSYDGTWYATRKDLRPNDVAAWVEERYREQLIDWGVPVTPGSPPLESPRDERETYLSVCAIFFNEAPYLAEWIEFHVLAGVERFFLYDHESTDSGKEVLAPYVEEGTVELLDWPVYPGQVEAFEHCAEHHRFDSRWIAFIDLDEYLFSPTGRTLPEVLRSFERWPAITVNRPVYGSSGHESPPAGLTIENYLLRSNFTRRNIVSKMVARPEFLDRCAGVHYWTYTAGHAVDETKRPAPLGRGLSGAFSTLRINHYMTRSRQECERKLATPVAVPDTLREWTFGGMDARLNDITDAAAATYAPAIKDALRSRGLSTIT